MSGKRSRNKGKAGELEFTKLLHAAGFDATRNRIGAAGDDVLHNVPDHSFEIKRAESLQIPKWLKQCEEQAGDRVPVLAFRRSREPWRVIVPAEHYLQLVYESSVARQGEHDAESDRGSRP